jgi:VCBS repeat-containing protein
MRRSTLSHQGNGLRSLGKILLTFASVLLISLIYWPLGAYSAQVTLAWDATTDAGLAGYKVYYGASSGDYAAGTDVGNQTSYTVQGLQEGETYYFAATAYDDSGNESDYSDEVSYKVPTTNTAPAANDGVIAVTEDTPATGRLSASDAEDDGLTYRIVGSAGKGSVTITNASTGAYTYTPNANANGADTFTFKANDGALDSSTATITVTIASVNDAPVAVNDTAQTDESVMVTIDVLANDRDVDGDSLSVASVTQGTKGTVAISGGKISYSPKASQTGTDTFAYTASDGNGGASSAQVSVTIASVNSPPTASSGTVTTVKGRTVSGKLSASDADGDALTYSIVSPPDKGVLEITNPATGAFTYKPGRKATGSCSFTYKVNDGKTDSSAATMSVTIYPHVRIWLEAENGYLASPMTVGEDETASGGQFALVPKGVGTLRDSDAEGGYAEYTFEAPVSGEYTLVARVRSDDKTAKAFYVSMDNSEFVAWNTACGAPKTWLWDKATEANTSGPFTFNLDSGVHTLVIKQREDGSKIDKILLTTQSDFLRESVYEDAEDGTIGGWEVVDADPQGAQIINVLDTDRQGSVIELTGSGTGNRYRLLTDEFTKWGNKNRFVMEWSLKYDEAYAVYVEVMTTEGSRSLVYLPRNDDLLGDGKTVRFGVGRSSKDGQWHLFIRDLQADLSKAQPGVQITKVNSFSIRGSGKVDDIKLRASL